MNWQCPYCNNHTTLINNINVQTKALQFTDLNTKDKQKSDEYHQFTASFIACPNIECRELVVSVGISLGKAKWNEGAKGPYFLERVKIGTWKLKPQGISRQYPDYIPGPIRQDYQEACLIKEQSPKAAATLARRCLQGMIRNFWGIEERTLFQEIEMLKEKVEPDVWEAINAVREVGNIGAHMKGDINAIIEIDDKEVEQLIWLIETLIKEWYIAREERRERLKGLQLLGIEKKALLHS